ncbi:MAG: hypothetical protein QOH45_737, partial [Pseudonocardiales bacterium]|nr:hypothetical protein [Pseudonocardiales bacterium]
MTLALDRPCPVTSSEQTHTEQTHTEQTGTDQTGTDQTHTELPAVTGTELRVPLVTGGWTRY